MKTTIRDILIALLVCLAGSPESSVSFATTRAEFTLQSNTRDLGLLVDGIITAVTPGTPLRGKVGLNEIMVTAPGYGTRKIRFWLISGESKTVPVDLAKMKNPVNPEWNSLDKQVGATRIAKLPSICVWYQEKTLDSRLCRRQTLLEDLAVAEPSLFAADDMKTLQDRKALDAYRHLVQSALRTDKETTRRIEDFYNEHAGIGAVLQLASLHHLVKGDCPRVHAVLADAFQTLPHVQALIPYKALCAEAQGQNEIAQSLYVQGMKLTRTPPPYLSFHAGRLMLRKSSALALEQANRCLKFFRFDLACQELGMMAARLDNKVLKIQKFSLEEGTFKTFLNLEATLPQGQFESNFFAVISLLNAYPQAIEYYLFLAWIDAVEKLDAGTDYYAQKMRVASILGGSTLDKVIESLEKQNLSQLLPPVYRSKLLFDATDPNLWLRLIRAYSKAGQCKEALAVIQEGGAVLPKYNAPLLQTQASCYVEQNRLQEALDIYLKILEIRPKVWSTYFNLAAVYERLKQRKEAIQYYKQTLATNSPPEVRDGVQFKLLELQKEPIKR